MGDGEYDSCFIGAADCNHCNCDHMLLCESSKCRWHPEQVLKRFVVCGYGFSDYSRLVAQSMTHAFWCLCFGLLQDNHKIVLKKTCTEIGWTLLHLLKHNAVTVVVVTVCWSYENLMALVLRPAPGLRRAGRSSPESARAMAGFQKFMIWIVFQTLGDWNFQKACWSENKQGFWDLRPST